MKCKQFDDLEHSFLEARRQWLQQLSRGDVSPEETDNLSRTELKALTALLEHSAEHGCQRPANERMPRKLPSTRNMGGIIGPY